jgi:DNA-binding transcriptional LysR family regulator
MEIRELTYFRAVAEELNFSRAAERLGIAQPPLSRAISQLERRLGVRLFDRDTRRVSLTPAGEVLLVEAARVLDAVSAAAHRTRRAGGSLVATAKPGIASTLLREVVAAHGEQVQVLVSGFGEQTDLVRTGRADVALIGSPHRRVDPWLDSAELTSEPRLAALPAGHALASRARLTMADLAGLPVPRRRNAPGDGPEVNDHAQLLEVVALGQAVALVPVSFAELNQRADLVFLPVADAPPYIVYISWPAGSRDRRVAAFVETATAVVERRAPAPEGHPRDGRRPRGALQHIRG